MNVSGGGDQVAKRALIVDDSRSARLSLARLLEKHDIEVDTAESAELAIEYLATHRPDAIFMDHMMPGMDGLQAVQAIKNNPRTATIPIMMFTTQEGEVYVGQARALGAIGVLPKQVKPADVTKVLYQLNLAVDRRSADEGNYRSVVETLAASNDDPHAQTHPNGLTFSTDPAQLGGALREQLADLRRTVLTGFDSQGDRLLADMHTVLRDMHAQGGKPAMAPPRDRLPWILCAAMAGACVVLAVLLANQGSRLSAMQDELSQAKLAAAASAAATQPQDAETESTSAGDTGDGSAVARSLRATILPVPYGAEPFTGSRLDTLRQLLDRLVAQGFQGTVDVRAGTGRFCLVGNPTEGFSLAPDDLPYARCDVVSGGTDSPTSAVRLPVAMADLMGSIRTASHDMVHVQVGSADGSAQAAYPPLSDALTAGEWNRAASANNRIEIRVR